MGEMFSMCPEGPTGFAFGCFQQETSILAKEVRCFELDFEVLDRSRSDADIICIAVVIVGDDC